MSRFLPGSPPAPTLPPRPSRSHAAPPAGHTEHPAHTPCFLRPPHFCSSLVINFHQTIGKVKVWDRECSETRVRPLGARPTRWWVPSSSGFYFAKRAQCCKPGVWAQSSQVSAVQLCQVSRPLWSSIKWMGQSVLSTPKDSLRQREGLFVILSFRAKIWGFSKGFFLVCVWRGGR